MRQKFKYHIFTDAGGRDNDDAAFLHCIKDKAILFGVADGVGSLAAGGLTAKIIKDEIRVFVSKEVDRLLSASIGELYNLLYSEVLKINKMLIKKAKDEQKRYGSTLTLSYIRDNKYLIVQVGDSRAYALDKGNCWQITADQTLAQKYRDNNVKLPKNPGELKQMESTLMQCMGDSPNLLPVCYEGELSNKSVLVVCSDGLSNLLSSEDFLGAMSKSESLKNKIENLGAIARERGEKDNITAVLVELV